MRPTVLSILGRVPLLQLVPSGQLEGLGRYIHLRRLPRTEILYRTDDPATNLYVLASGCLKLSTPGPEGDEVLLGLVRPYALLGEAAVFNSRRHTATAIALVESEVIGINANAFVDFVRHHPEVALRLLESFSHQLQRAQERMEDIAFLDVPARVAKRLIELALEFGEKTAQGYLITLRLTQSELAALVGASRESVNKALRLFAEKGLLRSERRGLLITDLAALQRRIY